MHACVLGTSVQHADSASPHSGIIGFNSVQEEASKITEALGRMALEPFPEQTPSLEKLQWVIPMAETIKENFYG